MADIWTYLAVEASEEIANRFVNAVKAAFEPLRHFPLAGAARDHLAANLRVTFHGKYAIYYLPRPDALVIIRVVSGARDIAALVERGGFK